MTTRIFCVYLSLVGVVATAAATELLAQAPQKPVVRKSKKGDYRSGIVGTVDELWKKSDAVVEVVVGPAVKTGRAVAAISAPVCARRQLRSWQR